LTGLSRRDPTLAIPHRKIPVHVPRVLSVAEVERLIDAARNPFERAVAEVLYSTGVRVSELAKIRLEDIDFADGQIGSIRVKSGKGGKDRVVLFGRKAARAMREYQAWRPSRVGFLFEAPHRTGSLYVNYRQWNAAFYVNRVQRHVSIGSLVELPTIEAAREKFDRMAAEIPGFIPVPARPYTSRAICNVIHRLAHRANLGRVHPHMLRRAFACHMLQGGASIRAIQDLLGHDYLRTTTFYAGLTAGDLKKAHSKYHPHEGGKDVTKAKA
jgi:site-specific recombinase XerD